MEMMKKIILFCLVVLAFTACKKQSLQPGNTTGPSVFYFNGTVNGSPVTYNAGVNNYYMYSSCSQQADSVYSFTAYMHQVNSSGPNAPNSIQIIINDYKKTVPSGSVAARIDTALKVSSYPFLTPTGGVPTAFSVTYTPTTIIGPDTVTNYSYRFSDGSTATTNSASFTHVYHNPGTYTATLMSNFSPGPIDTIQNIAASSGSLTTMCFLSSYDSTSGITRIEDSLIPNATYTVNWNFGDGSAPHIKSYPANVNDSSLHKYLNNFLLYNVTAQATDINSNKNISILKVNPSKNVSDYVTQLQSTVAPLPNPAAFSNINIVYTDGNGNSYSSANIVQPTASAFQITSVSSYQNNELNETTKMLHIKFNCQLKGTAGTIPITNGDAVIAVAYK